MANTPVFTMRLPPGIRGALNEIARTERRSVGNLITKVMEDYIEANGHMLCPECHGVGTVGMTEDDEPEMCDTCDGLGHVQNRRARGKTATPSHN